MLSRSLTSEEIARAYCQLIMVSTIGSNQIRAPTNNVAMCTLKVVYPDELGNNLDTSLKTSLYFYHQVKIRAVKQVWIKYVNHE